MKRRIFTLFITGFHMCLIPSSGYGQKASLVQESSEKSSFSFTKNEGQVSDQYGTYRNDIFYYSQSDKMSFYLRNNGVSYQLYKITSWEKVDEVEKVPDSIGIYRLDMTWLKANNQLSHTPNFLTSGYENFYLPVCPDGINNVKSFQTVTYNNIYEGIDARFYWRENQFEYDYIVDPEADYRDIRVNIKGAKNVQVDNNGDLLIHTPYGVIVEKAPLAFQGEKEIKVKWLVENNIVSFDISENLSHNVPLVIDPIVSVRGWGTYYGGLNHEKIGDSKIDNASNLYIAGTTWSNSYIATSGAHQSTYGGYLDAFLLKMNASGQRVWATYYGGNIGDRGQACAIDSKGNSYLAGVTGSLGVIATPSSHQSSYGGGFDAFFVKFNSMGIRQWGSYYGGSNQDEILCMTVDKQDNLYIAGYALSTNGISSTGAHQATHGGGGHDGFLAKFTENGGRWWSTYYGGVLGDYVRDVSVDTSLNVYIVGETNSNNRISTSFCHQPTHGGGIWDGYIAKFNINGIRLWGTYYGGNSGDRVWSSAIGADQYLYVGGETSSNGGIADSTSFQPLRAGGSDGFLMKMSNSGTRIWSTYYGGSSNEDFTDIFVNGDDLIACGRTSSTSSISTPQNHQTNYGGGDLDGFLTKFDTTGNRIWGTYYGGDTIDAAHTCVSNSMNAIFMAGTSTSTMGISTQNSHQDTLLGTTNAFIVKFHECFTDSISLAVSTCDSLISPSGKHTWHVSGVYSDTLENSDGCDSVIHINLQILKSQEVLIDSACFFYRSPSGLYIYYSSGIYNDTLINRYGCDSIIQMNLTIHHVTSQVSTNGRELTTTTGATSYQWIDCISKTPIPNAIGNSYMPNQNGSYAVIINQNGCVDTSDCHDINTVGFINTQNSAFILYPNPNEGMFEVLLDREYKNITAEISSVSGKNVGAWNFNDTSRIYINLQERSGLYILIVTTDSMKSYFRVLIQ